MLSASLAMQWYRNQDLALATSHHLACIAGRIWWIELWTPAICHEFVLNSGTMDAIDGIRCNKYHHLRRLFPRPHQPSSFLGWQSYWHLFPKWLINRHEDVRICIESAVNQSKLATCSSSNGRRASQDGRHSLATHRALGSSQWLLFAPWPRSWILLKILVRTCRSFPL